MFCQLEEVQMYVVQGMSKLVHRLWKQNFFPGKEVKVSILFHNFVTTCQNFPPNYQNVQGRHFPTFKTSSKHDFHVKLECLNATLLVTYHGQEMD